MKCEDLIEAMERIVKNQGEITVRPDKKRPGPRNKLKIKNASFLVVEGKGTITLNFESNKKINFNRCIVIQQ